MIIARLTREGANAHISVDGHAGYAEEGKDIVCSAVSSLICTLEVFLNKHGHLSADVTIEKGHADIDICLDSAANETILEFLCCGFENIAGIAPDHFKFEQNVNLT